MNYRELGRTGYKVSTIGFGAWAISGAWGTVDDRESLAALPAETKAKISQFYTDRIRPLVHHYW
jgi:aryl-alcohol dehydrogenase-like predicted oxidoreductase